MGGERRKTFLVITTIIIFVFLLFFVLAMPDPQISFVDPTLSNGSTTTNASTEINVSMIEANLDEFKFNWNGTNYTMYNDSLVLMYNFDNISSLGENETHIVDVSGDGNNGTTSGGPKINTTDCKFGNCITFDGANDFVNAGDIASVDTATELSGCAWVYNNNLDNDQMILSDDTGVLAGFLFQRDNVGSFSSRTDTYTITLCDSSDAGTAQLESAQDASTIHEWTYVCFTVELGSATGLRLYINGDEDANSPGDISDISAIDSGAQVLRIGHHASLGRYFNGSIDEVRIWNRSLTAGEIYQQYVSNLNKYDIDKWLLYANQSKSTTEGLDNGNYTYQMFAKDTGGNWNQTEERIINISADVIVSINLTVNDINVTIEGGEASNINVDNSNNVNFTLTSDPGGYRYWFMFNLTRVPNETINFTILNAAANAIGNYASVQVVYSYDNGGTWNRIPEGNYSYDGATSYYNFKHRFTQNGTLVATKPFYGYTEMENHVLELTGDYVNTTDIGDSIQGRDIYLITITNFSIPASSKKTIWIHTGEHSNEYAGMLIVRGMIDFLMNSTNTTAQDMRNKYTWKIVPMINVDGVYNGWTRNNAAGDDLSRDWTQIPKPVEAQVVYDEIDSWISAGNSIDIGGNFHDENTLFYIYNDLSDFVSPTLTYLAKEERFFSVLSDKTWYDSQVKWNVNSSALEFYRNFSGLYFPLIETPGNNKTFTKALLKEYGFNIVQVYDAYFGNLTVNLISPATNIGDSDGSIIFGYNASHSFGINNCSLIIDGVINQTNISITKNITQNFTVNNFAAGRYNWEVNCTDNVSIRSSSEARTFSVVKTNDFSGDTTDLTQVDVGNITNLVVDSPNYGRINFSEVVNLSSGGDINTYVSISQNRIEVNSSALPALNKSATLKLYNLTFTNPQILKDGGVCSSTRCIENNYSGGTLTFNVTSFSVYSARETPVSASSSAGSSDGGGTFTHHLALGEIERGYEKTLKIRDKIEFQFNGEHHKLNLDKIIDDNAVQITISSDPVTFNISVGEAKKVNLDNDSYYDLKVYLEEIKNYHARLFFKLISEEVPEGISEEKKIVDDFQGDVKKEDWLVYFNDIIVYFSVAVVFILVFVVVKMRDKIKRLKERIKKLRKKRKK